MSTPGGSIVPIPERPRQMTARKECPECGHVAIVPAEGVSRAEYDAWLAERKQAARIRMNVTTARLRSEGKLP